MHAFTDSAGREWKPTISIGSVRRVKAALQIDLLNPDAMREGLPVMTALAGLDVLLIADVVSTILEPDLKAAGVDLGDFLGSLDGVALHSAGEAVLEGVAEFFRSMGRSDYAEMVEAAREICRRAVDEASKQVKAAAEL